MRSHQRKLSLLRAHRINPKMTPTSVSETSSGEEHRYCGVGGVRRVVLSKIVGVANECQTVSVSMQPSLNAEGKRERMRPTVAAGERGMMRSEHGDERGCQAQGEDTD